MKKAIGAPKGEKVDGETFYAFLQADDEFCQQLGRAMLAAGRLEDELKRFLRAHDVLENTERAALGQLVKILKKHALLIKMQPALEGLTVHRNYLAHKIYPLLFDSIPETILEKEGLLDSDVSTYAERAWQLTENLNGLADIVQKKTAAKRVR